MAITDSYYDLSKTRLFLIMVFCNVIIFWLSRNVLMTDIVFYNTYSEQLTYERSMQLFESMKRYAWISYLLIPVALFIKFLFISIVLFLYTFSEEYFADSGKT